MLLEPGSAGDQRGKMSIITDDRVKITVVQQRTWKIKEFTTEVCTTPVTVLMGIYHLPECPKPCIAPPKPVITARTMHGSHSL